MDLKIILIAVLIWLGLSVAAFWFVEGQINSAISAAQIDGFRAGVFCGIMDYAPIVDVGDYKASPLCVKVLKEVRDYQLLNHGWSE